MRCPKESRQRLQGPIKPDWKLRVSLQNTIVRKEYAMEAGWRGRFKWNDYREGTRFRDKFLEEGGKNASSGVSVPDVGV
jgi:hypothetical protein